MSIPPFHRDDAIYRMVPIREADDCVRLGWAPTNALAGTVHGTWSVLMMWLCKCPMRLPLAQFAHDKHASERGGAPG